MTEKGFVYIVTNKRYGTLYTGFTMNLVKRIYEHKNELADGFTKKNNCKNLVWYETHDDFENGLKRERLIKKWHRDWKVEMIERGNPNWHDLYDEVLKKWN